MSSASQEQHSGDGKTPSKAAGAYSLAEIISQPECWSSCLATLHETRTLEKVCGQFGDAQEWLFIGCGSSYYAGLCAAASMTTLTGLRARAVPASEILLYPDLTLAAARKCVPVLISRSGQTSEVVKAAELLRSRRIPTLAISCAEGQALQELASLTIALPAADEKSTVMTRSFTSMLLALQSLAITLVKNGADYDLLATAPVLAAPAIRTLPARIRDFVAAHQFADYVCLGQGPFYGLACEYALKITEMSVSYAQAFHTLEFRHGPKSIVSPEILLIFLLSDGGSEAESDVVEEMKSLGGTILVVTNQANKRVRAAADMLVELAIDLPELIRLAPSLIPGQLLGLYTGLKKRLDPDSPRHLSRAVILDNQSAKKPEHAAF